MAWFTPEPIHLSSVGVPILQVATNGFQGDITTYTTQAEEARKWREIQWSETWFP